MHKSALRVRAHTQEPNKLRFKFHPGDLGQVMWLPRGSVGNKRWSSYWEDEMRPCVQCQAQYLTHSKTSDFPDSLPVAGWVSIPSP